MGAAIGSKSIALEKKLEAEAEADDSSSSSLIEMLRKAF